MIALGWVISNWKVVVAAIVAGYLGYHIGYPAGHHVGWSEGRAALVVYTNKAMSEKNNEAARARALPCITDPKCVPDARWVIDPEH
jgi:hypothetical protein